jgi:predicted kinase
MVGLPAAGKTTRAREIERETDAVRLTPDDWMWPLFGEGQANGARDIVEGRLIWLARRLLILGVNVVLDFGVWSREERSALRYLATSVGATCKLVYLPIVGTEQLRRRDLREAEEVTFSITDEELRRFDEMFEEPDEVELSMSVVDPPPRGYECWESWIAQRWPTTYSADD